MIGNADGSEARELLERRTEVVFPQFSPDGGSIAFIRAVSSGVDDIWVKRIGEANARRVELEVELPRALVWKVALLVRKGDTKLDELEQVDVAPHRLVVVVGTGLAVGSSQDE